MCPPVLHALRGSTCVILYCRYWRQFEIRQLPAWGAIHQLGSPAIGVPVDGAPRHGYGPADLCPGCNRYNSSCVCASRGYLPYDMAYLPILLPMSCYAWTDCGGAYPGCPEASSAASAAGMASSDGGSDGYALAGVIAAPSFPADATAQACSDPYGWSDSGVCGDWQGTSADGMSGGAMCGGAGYGGGTCSSACGGGGSSCGGGGCGG